MNGLHTYVKSVGLGNGVSEAVAPSGRAKFRYNDTTKKIQASIDGGAWADFGEGGGITALTGDVTASGTGSVAATIAARAVTFAKTQAISTARLLGRTTAGSGDIEQLTAADAKTMLGLVVGTDVQAYSAILAAHAGLSPADNRLAYFTGSATMALTDFTAAARSLLDDPDASAMRTTLGLGTLATQNGTFSGTSSGTNTGDQRLDQVLDPTVSKSFTMATNTSLVFDFNNSSSAAVNFRGTGASTGAVVFITAHSSTAMKPLQVNANGLVALDITSAGLVGIGKSSPGSSLDVLGTLRLSGSSSGHVGLAPAAAAGSTTYTLPSAAPGADGYLLSATMAGVMSWVAQSSAGAPADAQYLTLATNGTLTVERVFTPSTGLTAADGGAGAAYTLTVDLSTGKSGGQSVVGGTGSAENLTWSSTTHGTKGKMLFGTSAYDEANNRLGLGTTSPRSTLTVGANKFEVAASDGHIGIGHAPEINRIFSTNQTLGSLGQGYAAGAVFLNTFQPESGAEAYCLFTNITVTPPAGGTANNAYGWDCAIGIGNVAGTITNVFGLHIGAASKGASATVANAYGIHISPPTMTVTSRRVGLLISDSAPNSSAGLYVGGGHLNNSVFDGLIEANGNGTHVFKLPADATDPTAGGGAAAGRIPVSIGGATRYLAYY